jgi:hypothetical protein
LTLAEPQEVAKSVRKITNGETDWFMNATGGNKLMTFGAASVAPILPVIYRERAEGWLQISVSGSDFVSNPMKNPPAEDITDRLSIVQIVQAQFPDLNKTLSFGAEFTNRFSQFAEHLPRLTELLIIGEWGKESWVDALSQLNDERGLSLEWPNSQGGHPFETYIAALIYSMGINNIAQGVKVNSRIGNQNPVNEIDIIVNKNGKLLCFDAKMTSNQEMKANKSPIKTIQMTSNQTTEANNYPGKTIQLREAMAASRSFAGINTSMTLLRPRMAFLDDEIQLAEAYKIEVWDNSESRMGRARANSMRYIVENLARLLDSPISATAQQVDDLLQASETIFGFPTRRLPQ